MALDVSAYPWLMVCDSLDLALWLVDSSDLRVLYANTAAARLVGQPIRRMVGESVLELASTPEDQIYWGQAAADLERGIYSETGVLNAETGELVPVLRRVQYLGHSSNGGVLLLSMHDRSEQRMTEQDLQSLLSELRATLDCAADGVLTCDLRGDIRAFNQRWAQLWQLPEHLLLRRDDTAIQEHMQAQVQDVEAYRSYVTRLVQDPGMRARDVVRLRNGLTLECSSVPQLIEGRPTGRVFTFRDITQQAQAQAQMNLAEQAFEFSLDAIFVADRKHRIVRTNPSFERLMGTLATKAMGRHAGKLLCADQNSVHFMDKVLTAWEDSDVWQGDVTMPDAGAGPRVVRLSWVLLRDGGGAITQSIGFMHDLTEQHAAQARIAELAYSDALTGLPNRLQLGLRVNEAIERARQQGGEFALLFLDLDRFKIINDSMGHLFGDRVLQLVALRLQEGLRQYDMLGRLGGDEFILFLHGADATVAEAVTQRMLQTMAQPFMLDGMGFSIQCSIGVALYPRDGQVLDDLIKHADTAMYSVKDRGRGSYGFYDPQMNADLLPRMKMEHALRQALGQGHMAVHYQPQVAMKSGVIVGAEALLRWNDPQLGPVSPGAFITLAEESGYIVTLGAWMMEQAVAQAAAWVRSGMALTMAVNVSALEFRQPGFVQRVLALLAQHGLPARHLELELTESVLLQDAKEMGARVRELSEHGVRLSIDDFGTGYSSLAYLKQLAIHKLKIDKSFVDGLPDDEGDRAIVQAIVSMGRALRIEVLAEGVETVAQREALRSMDCGQYQGFLTAPALPAEDFRLLLSCAAQLEG